MSIFKVENPLTLTIGDDVYIEAIFKAISIPPISPTPSRTPPAPTGLVPSLTPTPIPSPSPSPTPIIQAPPPPATVNVTLTSMPLAGGSTQALTPLTNLSVGSSVTVYAQPTNGYRFVNWTSTTNGIVKVESTEQQATITVFSNIVLVANFVQIPSPSTTPHPTTTPTRTPAASPTPQPIPSLTPIPSPSVGIFVSPQPTPSPSKIIPPSPTPYPTPTSSPIIWRSCIDGSLQDGLPPTGYRQVPYTGLGGGMCWESISEVGFIPELNSIGFTYQRGSSQFPVPITFKAENPSFGLSYSIKLVTNATYFIITPNTFQLSPRGSKTFTVGIDNTKLDQFGDGISKFSLQVEVDQI